MEMGLLEQQQQLVDEMNGEGLQVPSDIEPLDFLLAIMRDPRQPMARRQKAATDAAQYRHPKLGAVAHTNMSREDFATMLDRAIERSGQAGALIEHQPAPRNDER
jgi:hypothetical protein